MKTGNRILYRFGGVLFLLLMLLIYIPDQNAEASDIDVALYHEALSLRNNLVVLGIALQPGYEDAASLSYLGKEKGARIVQAYLTNGDGTDNVNADELPPVRAAKFREEAYRAMKSIGIQTRYMNFPHLPAGRSSEYIRGIWNPDSVRISLMKITSEVKPDIVIVFGDRQHPDSFMCKVLHESVIQSVQNIADPDSVIAIPAEHKIARWEIERVIVEHVSDDGTKFPVDSRHPYLKRTYHEIGMEAMREYESLAHFRSEFFRSDRDRTYGVVAGSAVLFPDDLLNGITVTPPPQLRNLHKNIQDIAYGLFSDETPSGLLPEIVEQLDSVQLYLQTGGALGGGGRRLITHWRESLENIRNIIHNVSVSYSLSESILTNRQITYLNIDAVGADITGGETYIYFPDVSMDGWIVNESLERRLPLQFDEPYRLVSPQYVQYTYPHYLYGLNRETLDNNLTAFIIHIGIDKGASFIYKLNIPIEFTPKFTIEPLTPLVAVRNGEEFIYRLTNHSRDGVADTAGVHGDGLSTSGNYFRLPSKESSVVDTLRLFWDDPANIDSRMIPFVIGSDTTGFFFVKQIDARIAPGKVGIVTQNKNGALVTAVRRLDLTPTVFSVTETIQDFDESFSVIVVDKRALTYCNNIESLYKALRRYMYNGGEVIMLVQNEEIWNTRPFIPEITLKPTSLFDPDIDILYDPDSSFNTHPHAIRNGDWEDWIFKRASHVVGIENNRDWDIITKSKDGEYPFVVHKIYGTGSFMYVDLALHSQLINLHDGAMRILANILSR